MGVAKGNMFPGLYSMRSISSVTVVGFCTYIYTSVFYLIGFQVQSRKHKNVFYRGFFSPHEDRVSDQNKTFKGIPVYVFKWIQFKIAF